MSLRYKDGIGYGLSYFSGSMSRKYTASKGLSKKDSHINVKKAHESRFKRNSLKKTYVKSLLYDHGAGVF